MITPRHKARGVRTPERRAHRDVERCLIQVFNETHFIASARRPANAEERIVCMVSGRYCNTLQVTVERVLLDRIRRRVILTRVLLVRLPVEWFERAFATNPSRHLHTQVGGGGCFMRQSVGRDAAAPRPSPTQTVARTLPRECKFQSRPKTAPVRTRTASHDGSAQSASSHSPESITQCKKCCRGCFGMGVSGWRRLSSSTSFFGSGSTGGGSGG